MAGKNIVTFNEKNFDAEVLKSDKVVLVDFTATWCGPCRALAPIVEKIADEFEGKVKVGKLDIDEDRETPTRFDVMAVPTLIFFKGGKELAKITGLRPKAAIKEQLDTLLAAK